MLGLLVSWWLSAFCRFRWIEGRPSRTGRETVWWLENAGLLELAGLIGELSGTGCPCRVLVHAPVAPVWRARWGARLLGAVCVGSANEMAERTVDAHRRGFQVIWVHRGLSPEERVSAARRARATVIPLEILRTDRVGLGRPQPPLEDWTPAVACHLHAGTPIPPAALDQDALAEEILTLRNRALEHLPILDCHLATLVVRNLRRRFFHTIITDAYADNRSLRGGLLLAMAWLLADWIRQQVPGPRVGVVLPPGLGATLANLACLLADKTPVNLNFTMGRAANERAIAAAGLTHAFTAEAFVAKAGDFPWPNTRLDLPRLLAGFSRSAILLRALRVLLLPAGCILRDLGIPEHGGTREAGLLFTSGSSGDPKGVPLSHRNLIANILQVGAILPPRTVPSLLGCLPLFHSFGFTVTLWWPLAGGPRVVTYISPLDSAKIASIVAGHAIALLITTPTFLRSLLRKAGPGQLDSLVLVVTGAEKLPTPLLQEFESRTGIPVCEGYGMTEASPVISTNLTDRVVEAAGGRTPGRTVGSVGRPLYGIAVRVSHPETGEALPLSSTGMLEFRGANVFAGYLGDPVRNAQVLRDGWYVSGDVGHLDGDGFLYIDGRLSRFSKIAGEMVPHGTVETHLLEILRGGGEVSLAVVGIRDAQKGEALVVLANQDIDPEVVRKGMAARGLPNLWIPKHYLRVDAVPTLASGKLDLRGCQAAAEALLHT
ncbi:MAG: AMP-binding protein [Candidatus Methylacidiphilales bacterium]|nr:AMP-binding protein [Candidatus Methylacidiphilales bacterium]